jgi:hypothetical protein
VDIPEVVQEWIDVGRLREAREGILRLGAKRFGPAPAETEAALHAIPDRSGLQRVLERVLEATGWGDTLTTT